MTNATYESKSLIANNGIPTSFNGIRQLAPFILQREMQPGEVKVKVKVSKKWIM